MEKNNYGFPNILPKGVVEPIEEMDVILGKIAFDAENKTTDFTGIKGAKKRNKENL